MFGKILSVDTGTPKSTTIGPALPLPTARPPALTLLGVGVEGIGISVNPDGALMKVPNVTPVVKSLRFGILRIDDARMGERHNKQNGTYH
jgi:hypothetical protein